MSRGLPDLKRVLAIAIDSGFNRRLKLGIGWVAVLALGSFAGLRGTDLVRRRDQSLAVGAERAANLGLILAAYLRQTFASADASLRQLALYSRRVGGPAADPHTWSATLASARAGLTGIGAITVVDALGIIRHSTQPLILGQSRADQFLFRYLARDTTDALVANTPFRSLTGSGEIFIPLGRRLSREDGQFDGAIVASFIPAQVRGVFRAARVGREGTVWVLHPGGVVLLREPSDTNPIGELATENPILAASRQLGSSGVLRAPVTTDGPVLTTAFRTLQDPPLIIAVSLSDAELLSDWRHDLTVSAAALGFLIVVLTVMLALLFRQMDTSAAAQAALARSQRLESLGQLTGGVAHDFNNLLTVILGNANLLRAETAGLVAAGADQIVYAATRAAELTKSLLAFARRQPLQPRITDLNALVEAVRPLLTSTLPEDVTLTVRPAAIPCMTNVDPTQVETALVNLVVNARDAMPQGGHVSIETGRATLDAAYAGVHDEVTPGRYVVVAVSDTGHGIPKENLQRVLEPFFTTKEPGKGTGLGLSMVYGFVKQSGGHVKVYSEVGHGTTVKLYFPETTGAHSLAVEPPGLEATRMEETVGDEVVLVVEDEEQLRRLITRLLKGFGYRVAEAPDGRAAVSLARTLDRIDVLLTDVMLPGGMTGPQLADLLAQDHPGLPVVYMSGYSEEILLERAKVSGVEGGFRLVSKPFDRQQLAAALRAALSERRVPSRTEG